MSITATPLIYELYLSFKFASNGIHTDLAIKLAPRLAPINYDRWAKIYWKAQFKGNLIAPETQELVALESANTQTIEDVYDALNHDGRVQ